jgi:hypothetical protein
LTSAEERNCRLEKQHKYLTRAKTGTKKTKPKAYKYDKAQHKNELHQELLPAAAQPAPPPLRHHRVCQAYRVHLENFQGLLRKATPLRPQPLCGDANLLDVKTFLKLLKIFKKRQKKRCHLPPAGKTLLIL